MPDKKPTVQSPRTPRQVTFTIPNMPRPKAPNMPPIHRVRAWVLLVGFALAALFGGVGGAILQSRLSQNSVISTLSDEKKIVTNQSQLISQIAKNVGPSVVSVNVRVSSVDPNDPYSQLFNGGEGRTALGAGTGIIISSSGLIVTNRHVVPEGTSSVSVTLSDGTELDKVAVVGRTTPTDSLDVHS